MNPGLLNHLSPLVDIRLQPRLNLFRCACLDLDSKFEKSLFYVRSAGSPTVLDWSIHDLRQRAGESKQSIPEKPATPPSRKIRISGVLCELTDLAPCVSLHGTVALQGRRTNRTLIQIKAPHCNQRYW